MKSPETGTNEIDFLQVFVTSWWSWLQDLQLGKIFITLSIQCLPIGPAAPRFSVFTNDVVETNVFCTQSMQGWDGAGTSQTPPLLVNPYSFLESKPPNCHHWTESDILSNNVCSVGQKVNYLFFLQPVWGILDRWNIYWDFIFEVSFL